jgi:hypothetical protein
MEHNSFGENDLLVTKQTSDFSSMTIRKISDTLLHHKTGTRTRDFLAKGRKRSTTAGSKVIFLFKMDDYISYIEIERSNLVRP